MEPYEGISSRRRFVCVTDKMVFWNLSKVCCVMVVCLAFMVWGIRSAVQEDELGYGQIHDSDDGRKGYGGDGSSTSFSSSSTGGYYDEEPGPLGLTSSVFMPLALGFFCIGCMHCAELLYKYYVDNIVENLHYQGAPLTPVAPLPSVVEVVTQPDGGEAVQLTETSTMVGSTGRGCRFYGAVRQEDPDSPIVPPLRPP